MDLVNARDTWSDIYRYGKESASRCSLHYEKNAFCFVMVYDKQDIFLELVENQYVVSTLSKEVNIISRNKDNCCDRQTHVHEILGSVEIAGREPHTHRFAAVSGEAIYHDCDHVHDVMFRRIFTKGISMSSAEGPAERLRWVTGMFIFSNVLHL